MGANRMCEGLPSFKGSWQFREARVKVTGALLCRTSYDSYLTIPEYIGNARMWELKEVLPGYLRIVRCGVAKASE